MTVLFLGYAASINNPGWTQGLVRCGADGSIIHFRLMHIFLEYPRTSYQNRFIYGNIAILKRISVSEKREKCT